MSPDGKLVASGTPDEIQDNELVHEIYLGSEAFFSLGTIVFAQLITVAVIVVVLARLLWTS